MKEAQKNGSHIKQTGWRKRDFRTVILISLYCATACYGLLYILVGFHVFFELLPLLMVGYCATAWAIHDAKINGRPLVWIVQKFVFATFAISVPVYLVWTRGLYGFSWAMFHLIALSVVQYAAAYAGYWFIFVRPYM